MKSVIVLCSLLFAGLAKAETFQCEGATSGAKVVASISTEDTAKGRLQVEAPIQKSVDCVVENMKNVVTGETARAWICENGPNDLPDLFAIKPSMNAMLEVVGQDSVTDLICTQAN